MQPLLIVLILLIAGLTVLVMLYFLGNFQRLQRNRINSTPKVKYIPQLVQIIETPLEEPVAEIMPEEVLEPTPEITEINPPVISVPVVHIPTILPANETEHAPTIETSVQKKKRLRNWLLGGEIFDG